MKGPLKLITRSHSKYGIKHTANFHYFISQGARFANILREINKKAVAPANLPCPIAGERTIHLPKRFEPGKKRVIRPAGKPYHPSMIYTGQCELPAAELIPYR
jgi:hypothetical protein